MLNQIVSTSLTWRRIAILSATILIPGALLTGQLQAQTVSAPLTITTVAGTAGARQVTNGTGSNARFYEPAGIIVDAAGNLIVADTCNNVFRKVTPSGTVTVFSGTPVDLSTNPINTGSDDGAATAAKFYIGSATSPAGMWGPPSSYTVGSTTLGIDGNGNVYFADTLNDTIRKVAPDGTVTTIGGLPGSQGSTDGVGADARFYVPGGVAADSTGNVYVADSANDTIRKITSAGVVSTFAGTARNFGSADGIGAAARFNNPTGIAIDSSGNLYVTDSGNHTIRKITPTAVVTTLAGTAGLTGTADGSGPQARFNTPAGIAVDTNGNIYVADTENHAIRKISPAGAVTTIAGTIGVSGAADGTGTSAQFDEPYGVTVDSSGTVYIADSTNDTIRRGIVNSNSGSLQISEIPPAKVQVTTTANVTLKIVAVGTPTPAYQWFKDGAAISGATSATLTLSSVTSVNSGTYSVLVTSGALTYTSSGTQVQVYATGTPVSSVVLVAQPADQTIASGQSVTFSVEASSAQAMSYQWTKNGTAIIGATSASLTIPTAQSADAGAYAVTVTDGNSSITTANANLLVTGSNSAIAPAFTVQPSSQTASVGNSVTFSATASGTPSPSYQWTKNGAALANSSTISGATTSTLTISSAQSTDAGNYAVIATNSAGSATSTTATLTINSGSSGPTAWISNLSVRTNMSSAQTLIVGFTVAGGSQNVLVRAIGPSLATVFPQFFTSADVMADPRISYFPNGASTATATNDDWDYSLKSVMDSVQAFPLNQNSKDAAFVQSISGPNNTVQVQGTGPGIVLLEAYAVGSTASPRLTNISARNHVDVGANILIAGFVVKGTGTKRLLIRGIGPGLVYTFPQFFKSSDVLADPVLEIYDRNNALVATNDDWDSSLKPTFTSVGAYQFADGSADAALIVDLPADAGGFSYTAQLKGKNNGTGEGVVEVYELP